MKKIGFVVKDITSARALSPVANAFAKTGHKVVTFLEGQAINRFDLRCCSTVQVGTVEHPEEQDVPDRNWDKLLSDFGIELLFVGCSTPMHAERGLALAANRAGIPVIAFPDTWGAETRLGNDVRVDLWLATDHSHASMLSRRGSVLTAGSPLFEVASKRPSLAERTELAKHADPDKTILVVGQGYEYLPDIFHAALSFLRGTPNARLLLRLWHPKKGPDAELEKRFSQELHQRNLIDSVIHLSDDMLTTDTLATLCGVTVSAFSTTLLVANRAGKRAVSVHSEKTIAGMLTSTGLDFYPPAETSGGPIFKWVCEPGPDMSTNNLFDVPRVGMYPLEPINAAGVVEFVLARYALAA